MLAHRTSPLSNAVLSDLSLKPNHALRSAIREWDEQRSLAERYRSPLGGAQSSRRAVLMVSPVLRGLGRALRAAGGPLGWCRKYHVVHVAAVAMVAARLLLAATVDLQAEAQLQAELQATPSGGTVTVPPGADALGRRRYAGPRGGASKIPSRLLRPSVQTLGL